MAPPAVSTRQTLAKVNLDAYDLKVSTYDRVSSFLVSALVLLGVVVSALVVIWFTNKVFVRHAVVPVVMENIGGGVDNGVVGESMMIDAPDFTEIAMEADLPDPHIPETLAAITDAVGLRSAQLDDPALTAELLALPGESFLGDQMAVVDVEAVHAVRQFARASLAAALREELPELAGETRRGSGV